MNSLNQAEMITINVASLASQPSLPQRRSLSVSAQEAISLLTFTSLPLSPPLPAQGTLKPDCSGLVSGLANKAAQLKHGTGADDHPVVVLDFDTGYVLLIVTPDMVCTIGSPIPS